LAGDHGGEQVLGGAGGWVVVAELREPPVEGLPAEGLGFGGAALGCDGPGEDVLGFEGCGVVIAADVAPAVEYLPVDLFGFPWPAEPDPGDPGRHKIKRGMLLAAVAAAIVSCFAWYAPAASAAPNYRDMFWTNFTVRATGYCLDSNPAGAVYTLSCNSGPYQTWEMWVDPADPNHFQIVDHATGHCLDSNPAGDVYTMQCNGGPNQTWNLFLNTQLNSGVTISDWATGLNIDANGQGVNVRAESAFGGGNRYQTFDSSTQLGQLLGIYTFQNATFRTCLDSNPAGADYDGTCNGGPFQKWLLEYQPTNGYYTLIDEATGLCLDSNGSAQQGNGSSYTGTCNGGQYQSWWIYPNAIARTGMALQNAQTTLWLTAYNGVHMQLPCNCGYQAWWWNPA
jgi:hypothetical protein